MDAQLSSGINARQNNAFPVIDDPIETIKPRERGRLHTSPLFYDFIKAPLRARYC